MSKQQKIIVSKREPFTDKQIARISKDFGVPPFALANDLKPAAKMTREELLDHTRRVREWRRKNCYRPTPAERTPVESES
jgi:hypothetical protein